MATRDRTESDLADYPASFPVVTPDHSDATKQLGTAPQEPWAALGLGNVDDRIRMSWVPSNGRTARAAKLASSVRRSRSPTRSSGMLVGSSNSFRKVEVASWSESTECDPRPAPVSLLGDRHPLRTETSFTSVHSVRHTARGLKVHFVPGTGGRDSADLTRIEPADEVLLDLVSQL